MHAGNRLSGLIGLLLCVALITSLLLFINPVTNSGSDRKNDLKLYVFDCGYILIKDLEPFSPGNDLPGPKQLVDSCYLVQHPLGNLMWDAGLSDDMFGQPEGRKNLELEVRTPLLQQLESIGIKPDDIQLIAFSHLHFDHVGNARYFSQADWLIQRPEYKAAFNALGRQQGFSPKYYAMLTSHPTLLDGDHDVFGDGRVKIISAPGHSIGHQMLWVNLKNHGPILLSGDLYHFSENRRLAAFPKFNYSKKDSSASIQKIEQLIKNTGAKLLIQHDAEQNSLIPHAPVWLD